MSEYKTTIGLEIHAELKTKSKMFCGCKNGEGDAPNTNVCPICMGHPGTLPVINKEAVKKVLMVGTALNSTLADFTEFDRKNYFYPDIPKGYQISQYKYPLVSGGSLAGVTLTRIHLEEDTAKSSHDTGDVSLIDYNRAGVPLMELVTEPVIHSAEEAMNFGKEFQLLLQYLNVSDANMEKGEMRVEVNMSVSKTEEFGTKVEVKNINSFRAAGKAIEYEFKRQTTLLDKGEKVIQETRGWDENKQATFSQRAKESAHDYRYFPDPDLPKIILSEIPELSREVLQSQLPETPTQKRERLLSFGIKPTDVEVYVGNIEAGQFFDAVTKQLESGETLQLASNYIASDLVGFAKKINLDFSLGKITSDSFIKLIQMIKKGDLSSRGAKDTLLVMFEVGGDPEVIANEKGLIQKSNPEEVKKLAEQILNDNPNVVAEYKGGKVALFQFFIGQGMKISKGSVNPEMLKNVLLGLLSQ
ncbi:MAG: Asp-tRNA(Asn)/Glu-tRNA(Gln) amidotransferase subunit GatB [Patescibacteria group bacterium]